MVKTRSPRLALLVQVPAAAPREGEGCVNSCVVLFTTNEDDDRYPAAEGGWKLRVRVSKDSPLHAQLPQPRGVYMAVAHIAWKQDGVQYIL